MGDAVKPPASVNGRFSRSEIQTRTIIFLGKSLCTTFRTIIQSTDLKESIIMTSQPSADIRLYKDRASYSLRAALDSTSFVKERSPMSPSCAQGMKKARARGALIMSIALQP